MFGVYGGGGHEIFTFHNLEMNFTVSLLTQCSCYDMRVLN